MNADRLATQYRSLEYLAFGRALERCRLAFLPRAARAQRVLILGEGDGRFVEQLLARHPTAHIDVVELSARMIALAQARAPQAHFHQRDALTWLPAGPYDLLVTNFFLDCLTAEEAARLLPQLAQRLAPEGEWIIGDFQLPERGWRRWHAAAWLWVMYRFFAVTTALRARRVPDYRAGLRAAGLHEVDRCEWRARLIVSELWRR